MLFYSTKNTALRVDFKTCLFKGLPDDNGLFMPLSIPELNADFISNLHHFSLPEIAFEVAKPFLEAEIPAFDIRNIVEKAINFPAPVVRIEPGISTLELFHGPSLAFKDFGARFMAHTMAWYNRDSDRELTILVATSGDTGGAVAAGFFDVPGVEVVILYPSGKVSALQEKQLTTLGRNITAIELVGTFDDCQALVKQAFLDTDLRDVMHLGSANSINLARLIPQSFYYFEAAKGFLKDKKQVVFSVPSGNFGNLTAGLLAKRMGLQVYKFIAATNVNDPVPVYLQTGVYTPKLSVRTLSNAMDVGSPSNFFRMLDLYGSTWNILKDDIRGYAISDEETRNTILELKNRRGYTADPHGAVGYRALTQFLKTVEENANLEGVFLETAHPSKFLEDMENILREPISIPDALLELQSKTKTSLPLPNNFEGFKSWLLGRK